MVPHDLRGADQGCSCVFVETTPKSSAVATLPMAACRSQT